MSKNRQESGVYIGHKKSPDQLYTSQFSYSIVTVKYREQVSSRYHKAEKKEMTNDPGRLSGNNTQTETGHRECRNNRLSIEEIRWQKSYVDGPLNKNQ